MCPGSDGRRRCRGKHTGSRPEDVIGPSSLVLLDFDSYEIAMYTGQRVTTYVWLSTDRMKTWREVRALRD